MTTAARWTGTDRRSQTAPTAPLFGELLIEGNWRPSDVMPAATEAWLRSAGYVRDRRAR